MPRALRIEYPGAIYHVMNRRRHREPICRDNLDRRGAYFWKETALNNATAPVWEQINVVYQIEVNTSSDGADFQLGVDNITKVSLGNIHIVMTETTIDRGELAARTFQQNGTMVGILYSIPKAEEREIAHELGHMAGYRGNASDGYHSIDNYNLMRTRANGGGNDPDCQWCQKVFNLAK